MLTDRLLGYAALAAALVVLAVGLLLGRRFGAAIRRTGIGRGAPVRHSALAFLGDGLVLLGLVVALVVGMILFA